ncbi:hypothetical protein DFS33DRAFT_987799 [Desarmillaria ectypa]|nr:hypothetical protein DFS33DRAFT_987799 [Desarmillaria ectypa]
MASVTIRGESQSFTAELVMEVLSHADHDIVGVFRSASKSWRDKLNPIYWDDIRVTYHNHERLAALLTSSSPQIPRRLKNLTLSGSYGPPFWESMNTSPQGLHLSLPAIFDHFTEGMMGHLDIHSLNLSHLDDDAYEKFLQLVGSISGRSGATSISLSYPVFRTITDVAQLLTRCSSVRTVRAREVTVMAPMKGKIFTSDVQWAQKKVFTGRGGQLYPFSIMLDEHVHLDDLTCSSSPTSPNERCPSSERFCERLVRLCLC